MRRLVVGDIHGNHKGLRQALERSNFDYNNDLLISLGDLVDGHTESFEVIEELMNIRHLVLIKGNHDDWFNHWLEGGNHPANWQQGAYATIRSYAKELDALEFVTKDKYGDIYVNNLLRDLIPPLHSLFFKEQVPYYIDDDHNLFIHGGFNRHSFLANQPKHVFWWDRDLWNSALSWESMTKGMLDEKPKFKMIEDFKEVFIGHTSTQFWDKDKPMQAANIWNMDTGGGWFGKVTIMDVDTKEIWQSDNGNELYPEFKGRQ